MTVPRLSLLALAGPWVLFVACERGQPTPAPLQETPEATAAALSTAPSSAAASSSAVPVVGTSSRSLADPLVPRSWPIRDIGNVAFNGRRLAVAHDANFDGPFLSIYDVATAEPIASRVPLAGVATALVWGPRGERLAVVVRVTPEGGTPTAELYVFDLATAALVPAGIFGDIVVAFAPTSKALLVGHWGNVGFRDPSDGSTLTVLEGRGRVTSLAIRSDGTEVALARRLSGASFVEIWHVATAVRRTRIDCLDTRVVALTWSADWSRLWWAENDDGAAGQHHVAVVDRQGIVVRSTQPGGGYAREIVVSADGQWVLSLSNGPTVWKAADLSRHLDLRPGPKTAWGGAFVGQADQLALFMDTALRRVDLNTGRTMASAPVALGPRARAHAFSPDGRWLVAGSVLKTVLVPLPGR